MDMKGSLNILLNASPRRPKTIRSLNDAFKNTSDWRLKPLWFPLQYSGSEDQPVLHHNKEKEKQFEKVIKCVIKFFQYKSRKKGKKHKTLKFRSYVMCMGTYFVSVAL
jgi:hypothetical protein